MEKLRNAIIQASDKEVQLLAFPECALTGYPPHDIERASSVNLNELNLAYKQLQKLVTENNIPIIVGTITQEDDKYYNSAIVFSPYQEKRLYHKRAL